MVCPNWVQTFLFLEVLESPSFLDPLDRSFSNPGIVTTSSYLLSHCFSYMNFLPSLISRVFLWVHWVVLCLAIIFLTWTGIARMSN